jgi:hypothetical protein
MSDAHLATLLFAGPFLLLSLTYGLGLWWFFPRAKAVPVRVKRGK